MFFALSTVLSALSLISLVSAHGLVTAVNGANGIITTGFANTPGIDRATGSGRTAQGDTSVIRDATCGKTKDNGKVNIAQELTAIETSTGVPSAAANGQITATIHQVNADGAGPYTFEVSPSAAGGDWIAMTVQQNVCTGGIDGQTCVIRAKNDANAGPFGSCFAVTQNQEAAPVVKRIGVHSNWLVRKVGGISVSWEKYVSKKA